MCRIIVQIHQSCGVESKACENVFRSRTDKRGGDVWFLDIFAVLTIFPAAGLG